jgi:hypothetical protein
MRLLSSLTGDFVVRLSLRERMKVRAICLNSKDAEQVVGLVRKRQSGSR